LKLPSAGLRGSNGKIISRIGNGAYLWTRSPASTEPNTCIARLARDLGIRRNLIYKRREQLNTKQDKAFKRTANNADTPYHKATHSELLKQNKQLKKDLKLS
jgi:transposase-like protein